MSQIIVPSRKLWTPPQKQRGYVVLDAYRGGGGGGGGGGPGPWPTVASLLHFDGTSGSTSFADETGKVWTPATGPTINTTRKKYGTGCGLFPYDTNANGYIQTPHHADFDFGSGDFTIQCWLDFISGNNGYNGPVVCHDAAGGTRGWLLFKTDITYKLTFAAFVGGTAYTLTDPTTVPGGTQVHFAICRDGGTLRMYRAGVQVASTAISGAINSTSAPCVMGTMWNVSSALGTHRLHCYVDDLCINKGWCWYPNGTTFTPPVAALYPP